MKLITSVFLFSILQFACVGESKEPQRSIKLDGYWERVESFFNESTVSSYDCPATEYYFDPEAIGPHFLVQGDSISLFRYPYQYYGTFPFQTVGDSLFIYYSKIRTDQFLVDKTGVDTIDLDFKEDFPGRCVIPAEAKYVRFEPDSAVIHKLLKDSISYKPLADKWWYLRKYISYEDGTEPTPLTYPSGMPDSIFVSREVLQSDEKAPFIELRLTNRPVKMYFDSPAPYSFSLIPAIEHDKFLFSYYIDYGEYGGIDTIPFDVIYSYWN